MKRSNLFLAAIVVVATGVAALDLRPESVEAQTRVTPRPHAHSGGHRGMPSPIPPDPDDRTRRELFPYVEQPISFPVTDSAWYAAHASATDYTSPALGNGTLPHGGTAPFFSRGSEPPDIPSNFSRDGWWYSGGSLANPALEAKFRMHCGYSHDAWEDPILYPNRRGPYGNSHLHTFFGNTKAGADSTYKTLRTEGHSTCTGGPLNRSAYWYPAILKDNALGHGKTMIHKPNYAVVYYVTSLQQQDYVYRFPRGFQYIAGFDLADPTQSKRTAIIAAANAASTAGGGNAGYTRTINENANAPGFIGWKCEATNGGSSPGASPVNPGSFYQPYLKNADNTPTMVCPSNELIGFVINMQTCWDGYNLWSPDGRSHVMHGIRQSATRNMCPNGWFKLPAFELIVWFNHDGADDYKEWYFSSDRVPGGTTYKNGETGHADWYGGWDYEIMSAWMKNCIGITFEDGTGNNPNECNDSTLGDGRQMRGNNPPDNSRNPIWTATPLPSGPARYAPVPYNR